MNTYNNIAIIICNYNKKDYLEKCIMSLQNQSNDKFDIFVVDNASTDGSCNLIEELYSDRVTLIKNEYNLGGAGGFNTGMKIASPKAYKYIVLLDNDIILDKDCISILYDDMEKDSDIGIMGAKILKMDEPDVIQEFAPTVNYRDMNFELRFRGEKNSDTLPHILKCDYVPACALIVRNDVIKKIGYLPEENFIYYDDITWSTRCRREGFAVAANSKAVVWHKGGAKVNPTTFGTYYLTRNKLLFFMQNYDMFISPDNIYEKNDLTEKILHDIFEGVYACINNEMPNIAKTRFEAFIDAMNMNYGEAPSNRIRKKEDNKKRLRELIKGKHKILIYTNSLLNETRRIINDIYEVCEEDGKISIDLVDENCHGSYLMGFEIGEYPKSSVDSYDIALHVCHHIYELKIDKFDKIWIDGWVNILVSDKDYRAYLLFDRFYNFFSLLFHDRVEETIDKLKSGF